MALLATGWTVAFGPLGLGMTAMYTRYLPENTEWTFQVSVVDWPGSICSMYCVRSGDQSSGSTASPFERLTMFIATTTLDTFCVPAFVTTVSKSNLSPASACLYSMLIEICRG